MKSHRGFSLMEIVIVVVIVAIAAGIIVPRIIHNIRDSKERACFGNVQQVNQQIELFQTMTGDWPELDLADIGADPQFFPAGIPICPVTGQTYFIDDTYRIVAHLSGDHGPGATGGGGGNGGNGGPITWGYRDTLVYNVDFLERSYTLQEGSGPQELLDLVDRVFYENTAATVSEAHDIDWDIGLYRSFLYALFDTFVQQTPDGGFIIGGTTWSGNEGDNFDMGITKIDPYGAVLWSKSYSTGSRESELLGSVQQTADSGLIIVGGNFGVTDAASYIEHGFSDAYVTKLDSDGNIEWSNTYGRSGTDYARSVQQTPDGGFIITGSTHDAGGPDGTYSDSFITKIDSTGAIEWNKAYEGQYARSVQLTPDDGYIIAGATNDFGAGGADTYITKVNSTGTVEWSKTYGGSGDDVVNSIQRTADGGFVIGGQVDSLEVDADAYITKIDSTGTLEWSKTYGGSGYETADSIQQTADGGFVIGGSTTSYGAGNADAYITKLDSTGTTEWSRTYGGSGGDVARSVQQTPDGGFIIGGSASFDTVWVDAFIIKTDENGLVDLDGDGEVDPPVNQ